MSKSAKKIIVRVIKNKLSAGESFDDIIQNYPKLTEAEIEEIRKEITE